MKLIDTWKVRGPKGWIFEGGGRMERPSGPQRDAFDQKVHSLKKLKGFITPMLLCQSYLFLFYSQLFQEVLDTSETSYTFCRILKKPQGFWQSPIESRESLPSWLHSNFKNLQNSFEIPRNPQERIPRNPKESPESWESSEIISRYSWKPCTKF